MCAGGGGGGRIVEPDYRSANRSLDLQLQAMRAQQSDAVLAAQQSVSAALQSQQRVLQDLEGVKAQRANETAANARRLADLIGAPPPEKSASAPVIASNRPGSRATSRRDLRVNTQGAGYAPGAGLNL